jgi:H/ACA ribonucleoprotein complex non-core subunit NAF1
MAQSGIPGLGLLSNPTEQEKTPEVQSVSDTPATVTATQNGVEQPIAEVDSTTQIENADLMVSESQKDTDPLPDVSEQNAIPHTELATTAIPEPESKSEDIPNQEAQEISATPTDVSETLLSNTESRKEEPMQDAEDGPSVTGALEALLGLVPVPEPQGSAEASINAPAAEANEATEASGATNNDSAEPSVLQLPAEASMIDVEMTESGEPEFEVDSSPYASSDSDDSSSDDSSSSEDDSDDEDAYELLGPEEQARILMEEGGGSDDEGGANKGARGSGAQLRTKNEIPEEVIPKPDVTVTPDMKIFELGAVEGVIESIALIKANTSGEYRVLESGSVLCLEDKSVIGAVAETIGRVEQPLYTIRFTNATELAEAGVEVGKTIYYVEQHSTYVFTQALKAYKGSDASNLHDEEVGDEEMEFSDDEKEMEHKRRLKQKKLEKRGGKQGGGPARGAHPLQQQTTPYDAAKGLNYDEDEDGPYKPLARPVGFADTVGRSEAPQEGASQASRGGNNHQHTREPYGRGRGRGDRGRGRGDRGRGNDRGRGGRGGHQDRSNAGYSQPPQVPPMPQAYPQTTYGYAAPPQPAYAPQQQYPQPYQQTYPPPQAQAFQPPQGQPFPHFPNMPQLPQGWAPPLPTGGYLNPAFFGQQQQQQQQQQQGGNQQWAPPVPPPQQQGQNGGAAPYDLQAQLALLRSLQSQGQGGQPGGQQ